MRYPEFQRQGLFVGWGVVEAGCKTVIAARLKRSGLFWTLRGANAIIALRCCRISGKFRRLRGSSLNSRIIPHIYVAHPLEKPINQRKHGG